jgi:virulence factor Mce-like protein
VRRLVLLGLLVALAPWVVIGIVRAATGDDTDDHYFVRAVFDNASTLVQGQDVKIAGAPVGVVQEMEVTDVNKAAVVLRIDNEGFTPFKRDASCTVRLQGLVGEKFVECEPGSSSAEPLGRIEEGDGKGEFLLPVENTSSPVDLDIVNNTMRLPYRQRFSILLNELGTGLAGRGEDLNEVIHRANPALRETDEVLTILARQNRTLARLAEDSDRVLGPLARERESFADWIVQANETGEATAERREDLRRGINRLPAFLRELRLLMADLEGFADQGTPLLRDLGSAAPDLARLIRSQGTLADASRVAFPSLGDALERGRPALVGARPLIRDLGRLGDQLQPVSSDLDELTKSLDVTGAVERINDFNYFTALSTNGFDEVGHYLRAGLANNLCTTYTIFARANCLAKFTNPGAASASSDTLEARNASAPRSEGQGSVAPSGSLLQGLIGPAPSSTRGRERERNLEALRRRDAQGGSPALDGEEPMLDYLLGEEDR